eukprot:Nk52_evm24s280 gene=Nk52_evmTU24s280
METISDIKKALAKASKKNDIREEGNLCNLLGKRLQSEGLFSEAIDYHRRDLHLSQAAGNSAGSCLSHRALGECYAGLGEYTKALKEHKLQLNKAIDNKDKIEIQRAWCSIGNLYLDSFAGEGDTEKRKKIALKAEAAYAKSKAAINNLSPKEVDDVERTQMLASLCINQGYVAQELNENPRNALLFMERGLNLATKAGSKSYIATAHKGIGVIQTHCGDYEAALKSLKSCLNVIKKLDQPAEEAHINSLIGGVYLHLDNYTQAKRFCRVAYKYFRGVPDAYDDRYHTAVKYEACGKIIDLINSINEAEISESEDGVLNRKLLPIYEELGDIYSKLGYHNKSLQFYKKQLDSGIKALEFQKSKRSGKDSRFSIKDIAVIHNSIALTYDDLSLIDKCVEHQTKRIQILKNIGDTIGMACAQYDMANAMKASASFDRKLVIQNFKEALASAESILKRALDVPGKVVTVAVESCNAVSLLYEQEGDKERKKEYAKRGAKLSSKFPIEASESDSEKQDSLETAIDEDGYMNITESEEEDNEEPSKQGVGVARVIHKGSRQGLNKKNELGETPLQAAAIKGDVDTVRKLLKRGAEVNVKDHAGWTPLHETALYGKLELTKLLVEAGADLNAQSSTGSTALHDACMNGHIAVVEYLIKKGADLSIRSFKGKMPIQVANAEDADTRRQIVHLLKACMKRKGISIPLLPLVDRGGQEEDAMLIADDDYDDGSWASPIPKKKKRLRKNKKNARSPSPVDRKGLSSSSILHISSQSSGEHDFFDDGLNTESIDSGSPFVHKAKKTKRLKRHPSSEAKDSSVMKVVKDNSLDGIFDFDDGVDNSSSARQSDLFECVENMKPSNGYSNFHPIKRDNKRIEDFFKPKSSDGAEKKQVRFEKTMVVKEVGHKPDDNDIHSPSGTLRGSRENSPLFGGSPENLVDNFQPYPELDNELDVYNREPSPKPVPAKAAGNGKRTGEGCESNAFDAVFNVHVAQCGNVEVRCPIDGCKSVQWLISAISAKARNDSGRSPIISKLCSSEGATLEKDTKLATIFKNHNPNKENVSSLIAFVSSWADFSLAATYRNAASSRNHSISHEVELICRSFDNVAKGKESLEGWKSNFTFSEHFLSHPDAQLCAIDCITEKHFLDLRLSKSERALSKLVLSDSNAREKCKSLDFSDISLVPYTYLDLFDTFKKCQSISYLELSSCQLDNSCAISLAECFDSLKSLKYLDLSMNLISSQVALGALLDGTLKVTEGEGLQSLVLSHNPLGDHCSTVLGNFLSKANSLVTFQAAFCGFTHRVFEIDSPSILSEIDAMGFAEGLYNCSKNGVKALCLAGNNFGLQGLFYMFQSLVKGASFADEPDGGNGKSLPTDLSLTLEYLDLSNCTPCSKQPVHKSRTFGRQNSAKDADNFEKRLAGALQNFLDVCALKGLLLTGCILPTSFWARFVEYCTLKKTKKFRLENLKIDGIEVPDVGLRMNNASYLFTVIPFLSNLNSLNLQGICFEDKGAQLLSRNLRDLHALANIDISNCSMTESGMSMILKCCGDIESRRPQWIKYLNMSFNKPSDSEWFTAIGPCIENLCKMECLDLSGNGIVAHLCPAEESTNLDFLLQCWNKGRSTTSDSFSRVLTFDGINFPDTVIFFEPSKAST